MTEGPSLHAPSTSTSAVVHGDAELLQAHVDGDPDAFATLVERHQDRLWAVALRVMGSPDDAADALQDAYVAAFRRAATFRGTPWSRPGSTGWSATPACTASAGPRSGPPSPSGTRWRSRSGTTS